MYYFFVFQLPIEIGITTAYVNFLLAIVLVLYIYFYKKGKEEIPTSVL